MRALLLLPLLLSACHPFERWPSDDLYIEDALWDPEIIAATDGLYVRLPHAGKIVHVSTDGAVQDVDLGGAHAVRMTLAPDQQSLLVNSAWTVCDTDDERVETVSDCEDEDLREVYALDLVRNGTLLQSYDVPVYLNAFAFTNAGDTAVAYLSTDGYGDLEDLNGGALVDLNAVSFLDLDTGAAQTISVGFAASNILFSDDDSTAVVLSQSKAVVVDLATFQKTVEYPFTLDQDTTVDPLGAALTPDGRYALVSIRGSRDLYKLDLEVESIDILTLDGAPADLFVDTSADKTVIVYGSKSQVDLMDHNLFNIETVELDAPITEILPLGDQVLLYNDQSSNVTDLYRLDPSDQELNEYVVTNPVEAVYTSDLGAYALALLGPTYAGGGNSLDDYTASHWGLGILDLATDHALSLTLSLTPVGVALVDGESTTYALILLEDSDELLVVDLAAPSADTTVPLPAPALGIGAMPDGRFYITHDAALGMVSFLEPGTNALTTVSGFASVGLLVDDTLPAREEM